jgi:hypothetical protein
MKKILVLLNFIIPFNSYLQETESSNKKILLRGKVISSAFLEDAYFRNLSFGVEFRILNQHSIGFDYVHFRFRSEHDSIVNGIEYGSGPSVYSQRNYLNFDYRFYPFKERLNERIDPYLNLFVKIGRREVWSADSSLLYSNGRERLYAQNSNFADYGLASGIRVDFGSNDRFGLDFNVGCVRRISQIWYQKFETYNPLTIQEEFNTTNSKWVIHMRLNLYFRLLGY